jgi:hypothetical protein
MRVEYCGIPPMLWRLGTLYILMCYVNNNRVMLDEHSMLANEENAHAFVVPVVILARA